ncbi:hypothetical protein GDO78_017082 [Eleutherodactylus coqui]|uniref:Uncharacterized protein n=1 Tax=Eleutherodactylus coqui TaxID=57060 RepID=A0A8J6C833_ELECQ|nr:hypothetical protein GDO78_017082 [Eleutherodactylus coqui]
MFVQGSSIEPPQQVRSRCNLCLQCTNIDMYYNTKIWGTQNRASNSNRCTRMGTLSLTNIAGTILQYGRPQSRNLGGRICP